MQQKKQLFACLSALLIAAPLSMSALAQEVAVATGVAPSEARVAVVAETQAQVVGIHAASNSVTLRGKDGHVVDIAVDPKVGDVRKLRTGDTVDIEYRNALLLHADKVKGNGIRGRADDVAVTPASHGSVVSVQRTEVIATIEHVDVKRRLVTLRGPNRSEVLEAGPDVSLAQLKVGDSVHAIFESATAVQVTRDGMRIE